jgi:hypothetical protein
VHEGRSPAPQIKQPEEIGDVETAESAMSRAEPRRATKNTLAAFMPARAVKE